jgi:hypothetical protein
MLLRRLGLRRVVRRELRRSVLRKHGGIERMHDRRDMRKQRLEDELLCQSG